MSRSKKKFASGGMCHGSNTEFYRDRNRSTRNRNRHMLRNLLANMTIEEIADVIYNLANNKNRNYTSWEEPTDGHWHARTYSDFVASCNYPHYDMKDYPHENDNRELTKWRKREFERRKRK